MKVLIAEPISDEGIDILRDYAEVDIKPGLTTEELISTISDYEALVVRSQTKVSAKVIEAGQKLQARWTTNFHTGGTVAIITDSVGPGLKDAAEKISRLAALPLLGVDFLVDETDQSFKVVELAPDVAISPRGGNIVAKRYIDYLFPETT